MDSSTENRIKFLMDTFGISPSSFADKLGIKRAAVSHILSGRNKASLDVVQKLLQTIPEISPNWIIFGYGDTYVKILDEEDKLEISKRFVNSQEFTNVTIEKDVPIHFENKQPLVEENKKIEKIMIFYSDKTFDTYTPN